MKNTMKNILNRKILLPILGFCIVATMASCSKWSDVDSKAFYYPSIEEQNPELYAQYLEKLKAYKDSEHKFVYAWFDNSQKKPTHRSQHINNVPDSIDAIILSDAAYLADWEIKEVDEIREKKGIKTLFAIHLDQIKKEYNLLKEEQEEDRDLSAEEAQRVPDLDFSEFLIDKLQNILKPATDYNYDGLCIGIQGKSTLHMFPEEKKKYIEQEQLFMGVINTWIERNEDKMIVFEGKPQNLIDKEILKKCKHIIIPTHEVTNASSITHKVTSAMVEGVPADRFIVTAQVPSMDSTDAESGFWADQSFAVVSTAIWGTGHFNFTIAGIGILNINADYYKHENNKNPNIYSLSREAINILNPSLK